MNVNWELGVGPSADALLAACNAALDECSPLTDADVRMIASALKDHITGDRATKPLSGGDPLTIEKLRTFVEHGSGLNPYNAARAVELIGALETENAQHVNAIECLRQELKSQKRAYQANFELQQEQVDGLVLALMWCKPRLRHEAYQQHVAWTLEKYPKPKRPDEPRIVRSENLPGKNHSTDDALAPVEQSAKRIGEQPEAAHGDGCRVEDEQ